MVTSIQVTYVGVQKTITFYPGTPSEDIKSTLRATFSLPSSSEIILVNSSQQVVVLSPSIPSGEYPYYFSSFFNFSHSIFSSSSSIAHSSTEQFSPFLSFFFLFFLFFFLSLHAFFSSSFLYIFTYFFSI
jgi:hypothetical protein